MECMVVLYLYKWPQSGGSSASGSAAKRTGTAVRIAENSLSLTPFPPRGSAIASPSENLIETRFALDRERPRRTRRDAGSTGRHRPGTSSSRLPAADGVPKGPQ